MLTGNASLVGGSLLGGGSLQQQTQQNAQAQANRDPKVSDLAQNARLKLEHLQYVRGRQEITVSPHSWYLQA